MNTRIEYSYRDGANYKQFGHIVITGQASQQQVEALRGACMQEDGYAYFVPESVGMARLSPGAWDDEIDHPFHILGDVTLDSIEATDDRSIYDLIADFKSKNWEEEAVSHPGKNGTFNVMPIQRADAKAVANIMR